MSAPQTENEVRYQNAALTDENERLRKALSDVLPYVESYTDEGPEGEGWKSPEAIRKLNAAYEALKMTTRW